MFLNELQQLTERAPLLVLVLFRVAGLVAFAPLLGLPDIPVRIRVMVALVLACAVWPLVPVTVWRPDSLAALAIGIGGEMVIGLAIGFVLTLMFTGVRVGAELISQQLGFSMAEVMDPISGTSSTLMEQFFLMLTMVLYVMMNGHLILIRELAESFAGVPLLSFAVGEPALAIFTGVLTSAFQLGIRIAGPTLVAVFLATLTLGFISRTMPQLNILAAGFTISILISFLLMIASLGMILGIFQESILYAFSQIGLLFL